ncbi:MAG: hypothetical protein QM776_17905 [Rhodocyclaceae bacterium]
MLKHFLRGLALLAALATYALPAYPADVVVNLQAFVVSSAPNGGERLQLAETARPGDTIEYRATYRNTGKATVRNVLATLPVPETGMSYLADTARPVGALASLDGIKYEALPLRRTVTGADGRTRIELVPLSEYRFLRWQLGDMPAGSSATVRSRMRLADIERTAHAGATR